MAGWQQLSGRQAVQPQLQTVNLHDVLAPIIEEYRHWCQGKHIMLRYRPLNILVYSDVQFLQRIVRNLLSNATRYTDSGGRILVGARRYRGTRWLVVVDTGIGMNAEQASQRFEAFRRFGAVEKIPQGMGIGLYSVKQMAHALGLQTSLRSTPGKGTTIGISIEEA
jgi:two-component system, sensor histidine kinase